MHRTIVALIFTFSAAARIAVHLLTRYTVDDAFITFRYAENIASGLGFVYNQGEAVLGTTTPLFAMMLAALNFFGIPCLLSAVVICVIASGVTSVLLYLWCRRLALGWLSLLPALLYALFPRSLTADISGMETGVFTLLLVLSFYLLHRKRDNATLWVAALAAVTRPEGFALLLFVVLRLLLRGRVRIVSLLAPIFLIPGNWLLFSYLYFGTIIPNSVSAKSALYFSHWNTGFVESLRFLFALSSPVGWVMLLFALGGIFAAFKRDQLLALFGLFAVGYLTALAAGNTHIFFWYPAPVYPLLFLLGIYGLQRPLRVILDKLRWREVVVAIPLALLIIAAGVIGIRGKLSYLKQEVAIYKQIHQAAGRYLAANVATGERLLAEDIGQLGYIYRGNIIDRDGLVTPQAIHYNRDGSYLEFVDSVAADWVFITIDQPNSVGIVHDPHFRSHYRLVRDFGSPGANNYALFCRHSDPTL